MECKRKRDNKIYSEIRNWEKARYTKLPLKKKKNYLDSLQSDLEKLQNVKEKIPVRSINENKIWRFNSDITQLRWRIGYLSRIET